MKVKKSLLWNFFWTGTTLLRIKWLIHCHVQIDFKSLRKNGTTKPSANDIRDSNSFGTLTSVENLSFGRRTSIINQSERINSKTANLLNLIFLNRNVLEKKSDFQFLEFCKNGRSKKEKSFLWRKIEWIGTRGQGHRKKVKWIFHGKIYFCQIFLIFAEKGGSEGEKSTFQRLITLIWPKFTSRLTSLGFKITYLPQWPPNLPRKIEYLPRFTLLLSRFTPKIRYFRRACSSPFNLHRFTPKWHSHPRFTPPIDFPPKWPSILPLELLRF